MKGNMDELLQIPWVSLRIGRIKCWASYI